MASHKQHISNLTSAIESRDKQRLRTLSFQPTGFCNDSLRKKAYIILLHGHTRRGSHKVISPALKRQLELDVIRCQPCYLQKGTLSVLVRLFRSLECNYYQGFHEIAMVLYGLLGYQALGCLQTMSILFLRDYMKDTFQSTSLHCSFILILLRDLNEELASHIETLHDFQPYFTLPWILTWFSHHMKGDRLKRVFDVLVSSRPNFILFLSAQLLQTQKEKLLKCHDMSDILSCCSSLDFSLVQIEDWIYLAKKQFDRMESSTLYKLGTFSMVATYQPYLDHLNLPIDELLSFMNRKEPIRYSKWYYLLLSLGLPLLLSLLYHLSFGREGEPFQ